MEDGYATVREEACQPDGGDADRPPGKKIAGGAERGEEGDAKAAVGHGVEEAVTRCGQEEIRPHRKPAKSWDAFAKCEKESESCQKCSEENGMRKAAMSPEVTVAEAETEANDVQVGNDRAERSGDPDALRGTGPVKAGADTERGYGV